MKANCVSAGIVISDPNVQWMVATYESILEGYWFPGNLLASVCAVQGNWPQAIHRLEDGCSRSQPFHSIAHNFGRNKIVPVCGMDGMAGMKISDIELKWQQILLTFTFMADDK
jgi:hypothetical protein